ncbi:MAG: spore maturation protein [Proteobacteria bacterium]|nr:spore maturation protein [Desulfobacula sp.]MBU3952824.1 spore maturation protein [Pseudomonadota bacterium]MBU4131070.1 spore maturation protein [Pseudomonadota bacterium]
MNKVFVVIVFFAFIFAGFQQISQEFSPPSPMELLSTAMVDSAASAVELAIGLVGVMTLFLGLMKVVEEGGMLRILAKLIRPLMVRLFPDVPPDHPAMGAMILNLSANALGLGNAATPFGIKAMQALDTLNPNKGTATNAMALFLAINTSSVTLLPTGVIALRAAAGSVDPAAILPTTLFATIGSTLVAILAARLFQRFSPGGSLDAAIQTDSLPLPGSDLSRVKDQGYPFWVSGLALVGLISVIPVSVLFGASFSPWILPSLMVGFLLFGLVRGVKVYEVFVEGAKDGFQVALRIIPYMVAILVAVGMLRASGGLGMLVELLGRVTVHFGLPPEALPMALMRPLSGSGAYGIMASIINDPAIGPDSYTGLLVSTLQGSTETSFYVMAVYCGAAGIRRIRHSLAAALTADLAGVIFAVMACSLFLV